uniref:TNF receptor-associated factor 6 n=1 Tax=Sphaerodactylus townsendi TaxID=933632 RepID=A0ACB8G3U5_9SAUR
MASSCSSGVKEESDVGNLSNGTDGTLSNSFVEEIQGYDVEFDPPLKSKYECPICVMALREAVQTRCGHHFCKACIVKSIRTISCIVALRQKNVLSAKAVSKRNSYKNT